MSGELLNRPSKKQRELLTFIDGFIKGHGYGPSYREVMRALNYKSVSTVATHINGLINKGYLIKKDNSARSLIVVDAVLTAPPTESVTKTQEKWLIDKVSQHFEEYELDPREKILDELYVLTGALTILGLDDAATAAKARLKTLADPKSLQRPSEKVE